MTEEQQRRQQSGRDTTAELWDRIADDIAQSGSPCLETIEKLVDDACQSPPEPCKDKPGR